jgi:hypothetical protein
LREKTKASPVGEKRSALCSQSSFISSRTAPPATGSTAACRRPSASSVVSATERPSGLMSEAALYAPSALVSARASPLAMSMI